MILLHNATGSTRDWRRLAPRLAEGGFRVIAYDRRGFGRSDPLPQPDWPLDYLHHSRDELLQLMDALELEEAILFGNSDGATLALLAAAAAPQRVRAVIAESPHMWYVKATLLPAFEEFQRTTGQSPRLWKAMRRAHGSRAEEVVTRWRRRWLDPAFFAWNDRAALADVIAPVLVVHGLKDAFFPVEHSVAIASLLARAEVLILEDVGHTPSVEEEIVNDYAKNILDFLSLNQLHQQPSLPL
jgi:pimeloyl-ACP methyl ester carboxylesterase